MLLLQAEISSDAPKKVTRVIEQLEKETKAPRNGTTKMAKEKTKWIEYLLDKYGEDYDVYCLFCHFIFYPSISIFLLILGNGHG